MPWVFFLLAGGSFFIVLHAESGWLLGIMLLATLGFMLAGVLALASARINRNSRNEVHILSPEELRALRRAAQQDSSAAKSAAQTDGEGTAADRE